MKIVLTGSDGQLGYECQRSLPQAHELIAVDRAQLDITDHQQVTALINAQQPDVVINAAAYTAVDQAESEPELAWAVNRQGAENLAHACQQQGIRMVQISTDFVFSGQQNRPYLPDDPPDAASVYGKSKQAGEQAVLQTLGEQALVVRTSWLYSAHGHNFVKTMLKLMQERDSLTIIYDQIGTPTWAATLANNLWVLIDKQAHGIYHCADNGVASWYDFAIAIQEEALARGLLNQTAHIHPIRTAQYPTPAVRPAYSVLDKEKTETLAGRTLPHWRESLRQMLAEMTL